MTVNQIVRYTALVKRRSEILLSSGKSWKKEYREELKQIDKELAVIKKEMVEEEEKYKDRRRNETKGNRSVCYHCPVGDYGSHSAQ